MKQLLPDGRTLDTDTGEVVTPDPEHMEQWRQNLITPRPKWDPNRPSPGEPRIGAQEGFKIPKQFPGRPMRERKGE